MGTYFKNYIIFFIEYPYTPSRLLTGGLTDLYTIGNAMYDRIFWVYKFQPHWSSTRYDCSFFRGRSVYVWYVGYVNFVRLVRLCTLGRKSVRFVRLCTFDSLRCTFIPYFRLNLTILNRKIRIKIGLFRIKCILIFNLFQGLFVCNY